ncbi:MAG: hypothetical protein WBB28_24385 [Crinalium sp.]
MDIIADINGTLKKHNLEVKLGLSSEDDQIREGKVEIYCDKPIESQLLLVEVGKEKPKKILQVATWNQLLDQIKAEYGKKFFRENRLFVLREKRYSQEYPNEDKE